VCDLQVYNQGPLDNREPLYHSDPFFMAFSSRPGIDSVYGVFVDNAGQVCVDIGSRFQDSYLLGTRFNDMDYYFVLGSQPSEVLTDYTALVGRPRLRPRYALGFHQVRPDQVSQSESNFISHGWCRFGTGRRQTWSASPEQA